MSKRSLVTGANGFVGRDLCRILKKSNYTVRPLNRNSRNRVPEEILLDLTSDNWHCNPCEGIDVVFHLAGKAHALAEVKQDLDEYWRVNFEGTRKLLEAAKNAGVERFIFFSSVKSVDDYGEMKVDESYDGLPNTPYGLSKREAEQLVLHGGYVPHAVVIRPCMIYGNTGKGNLSRMISVIKKGIFPPLPDNKNKRSMVHVDDVVQAAILAAECPQAAGQTYIVSDGQTYSSRQIYDWIRAALGKHKSNVALPLFTMRAAAGIGDLIGRATGRRFFFDSDALQKLTASAWYSSDKIVRELGFCPNYSLKDSLPDIIRYLDNS